jgi:hypothetical protein
MDPYALTLADHWQSVGFTPNPNQEEAILHTEGPLYLPAGPGSGNTRVLLWRALHLIVFHGVLPEEIYRSTFTEKAALQLTEGLRVLLGHATNHANRALRHRHHVHRHRPRALPSPHHRPPLLRVSMAGFHTRPHSFCPAPETGYTLGEHKKKPVLHHGLGTPFR